MQKGQKNGNWCHPPTDETAVMIPNRKKAEWAHNYGLEYFILQQYFMMTFEQFALLVHP
jgi:hypothetical protein